MAYSLPSMPQANALAHHFLAREPATRNSMPPTSSPAALFSLLCEHVPLWECGTAGPDNAFRLATGALQAAATEPALALPGALLARFAWEQHPLDPRLLNLVTALDDDTGFLGVARDLARGLTRRCRVPQDHAAFGTPTEGEAVLHFLRPRLADAMHGAFWLGRGFAWCLAHDASGRTLDTLLDAFPHCDPRLAGRLRAEHAIVHKSHDEATALLTYASASHGEGDHCREHRPNVVTGLDCGACSPDGLAGLGGVGQPCGDTASRTGPDAASATAHKAAANATGSAASLQSCLSPLAPHTPFAQWYTAQRAALLRNAGQTHAAAATLRPLWKAMPWHPDMALALHDLCNPLTPQPAHMPPPAVLLYSWNKCDVLADTLSSLRATISSDVPVHVLDNGSTDGTGDMLAAVAGNWGAPLDVVTLPVNIGAPAARNWLLSLEAVRRNERVVFLDDDVLLDAGWLQGLLAVSAARPKASVIGCRITDSTPPYAVQCADFFALPPGMGQRSFSDLDEQIFIHCNAAGSLDTLFTARTRPCLSVSGCCHLITMRDVARCGAFDVRFTPSQFDDLERDIRSTLAGGEVWYAGQVRVRHVQHSSLRQATSRAKSAHIFGNKIKLEHLYQAPRMREARERTAIAARHDLMRKITQLGETEHLA